MDFIPYDGLETQFQQALARHIAIRWPCLLHLHIANERKTNIKLNRKTNKYYTPGGNRKKAEGVKAGVPDNLIFNLMLAIELKIGKNEPTEIQYKMMDKFNSIGWSCFWTNSLDEALKIIETYIEGRQLKHKKFKPVWE